MATSQHSSKISKIILEILETESFDFSVVSDEDAIVFSDELDGFLEDVWLVIGDTEFNRSGLRNATDSLIDFLKRKGYYSI